jgi:beta-alanine--pyruvate transaminase
MKNCAYPLDLDAFWMPFTPNKSFKSRPRMIASADGLFYTADNGQKILDGSAGLWCCNLGHNRPEMIEAMSEQYRQLDFAPSFNFGHNTAFQLASNLARLAPVGMDRVFFTNSGSESIDTALKMAIAFHALRGEPDRRVLIGRDRGYHGVNFGGTAVGGIPANRAHYSRLVNSVDHLGDTYGRLNIRFGHGQPESGAFLADDLTELVTQYGEGKIAAVVIEPVAGSTGVLPPPKGYLARLRQLCDSYGILLIFDEVITGLGRLGSHFAADYFDVKPDMIVLSKGLTNGVIPLGAVIADNSIHQAFMNDSGRGIEFFHGYTYSGNPVATAAALANLKLYDQLQPQENVNALSSQFAHQIHDLRDLGSVTDIRNIGFMGGIDLLPNPDHPGQMGQMALQAAFECGLMIRVIGDTITISPPLIISKTELGELFARLRKALLKISV